ncbi:MAG: hypothetical protein AAF889_12280 [Cyanobacteria bacterium P01_D01_bin.73]
MDNLQFLSRNGKQYNRKTGKEMLQKGEKMSVVSFGVANKLRFLLDYLWEERSPNKAVN